MRQRKLTFAFLALLLLVFAACKSESPTAPPLGPGQSGGVTPPTAASLTVTVSNANPVVNSTSVITATVTQNGSNVANGTAVQFTAATPGSTTTPATFTDTSTASAVKTTTNGVATATVTSASPGLVTITVTVGNVFKTVNVTFGNQSVTPPPTSNTPTITAVTPNTGLPTGGQQVAITGTNFIAPVRVLFDTGDGNPKEAFVSAVTPTQISVLTPAINLTTGQTQAASVIVITQAGTSTEQRVVSANAFTYEAAVLTPDIRALSPTSGPVNGGTRVTIMGDAFQAPVQVSFGSAQAQVISVNFNQIIVMSPKASDTSPTGAGPVLGPVDVIVTNINSNKSATMTGGFRYVSKMQITTVTGVQGPFTGGTRMTIDGQGFVAPLAVVVAGVGAQVISVSATEIVAVTNAVQLTSCGNVSGPIVVTNTDNGDTANGPTFIYQVPKPLITSVSNPNTAGGTATITVLNALGFARITIGGIGVPVTGSVVNPDGTTTFTVSLPPTIQLNTVSCPAGGSAPTPTAFDVGYTSATTGCSDTLTKGITISPAAAPVLFVNPGAFQPFVASFTPFAAGPPVTNASEKASASQTLQVINTGTTTLNVTAITSAGAGCPDFSIVAPPPPVALLQCDSLPLIATYNGPPVAATATTPPPPESCTVTITTNAGNQSFLLVGSSQ